MASNCSWLIFLFMNSSKRIFPVLPPATLAILGGGQLGRYFVIAAHELGYPVWVLDPDKESPAGRIANKHLAAPYDDPQALAAVIENCALVTTEFENVPAAVLRQLQEYLPVHPNAAAVSICQNRALEKAFLQEHHLPHGPFAKIQTVEDILAAPATLFPGILKTACNGYDGKGQIRVENHEAARQAFQTLGGDVCVLEKMLKLDTELSVVLARGVSGDLAVYSPAENQHQNGILDLTRAPAGVSIELQNSAQRFAKQIASDLNYIGVMAVEFFVCDNQLYVNEIAPRPHNSGHHTLDACHASQYEQQVRAVCGLTLAQTTQHTPAVMVNILGDVWFSNGHLRAPNWATLLALPGLKLHLYGKTEPKPGRKMGHFTVTHHDADEALRIAQQAREILGISFA